MRRTVGTVVVMLVALFAVPVLGREFGAWRADGTARWGRGGFTSRDTESANTGYMGHDYLSDPNQFGPDPTSLVQDAFPWGIFWTSLDVNEADITKGVGPTLAQQALPGGLAAPGIPNNPLLLRRFLLSVFSPVVFDLGGAPEVTPDHMVVVPRNVLLN